MKTKGICFAASVACSLHAQSFDSGSTGSAGALVLTRPGVCLFEPGTSCVVGLKPSRDNVYHFTSVYIGRDVAVKLSARVINGPLFWLVQGPVQIEGTIDLDGTDGGRTPSVAGAGGYAGGAVREPGYRPEGFTPNSFLVPLVGGFGGDGGDVHGGGAGGGALLIASSTSITVNGAVTANGGASKDGVGGDGGAIRLVAPVIHGTGVLSARGGEPRGTNGRVRFEAYESRFTGDFGATLFSHGKPFGLFLPPNPPPSVRVISIGGVATSGSEFTLQKHRSPVAIVIEAQFIPPGTIVDLEFFPEHGLSQSFATTPLEGSYELSYATASVAFLSGTTRAQIKAAWRQPTHTR